MAEIDYGKIEAAVREAGKMMLTAHLDRNTVHEKEGGANFVTDYDVAIQRFLIERFRAVLPEASYYGEEETEGVSRSSEGEYVFYIDPIDGTTNFMLGYHHSCVSVGLAHRGRMIAGFVYDPFTDRMYAAVRGRGSTLNGRPLRLGDTGIENGLVGFDATRYNEGTGELIDILFLAVKELYRRCLATREGGSAALGLCQVAAGANAAYIQMVLKPYDYAAASVIVEEAGGVMTQMDGSPIVFEGTCSMICGTKRAWAEAKEIVDAARRTVKGGA